jgi:hypothetical protein
MTKNVDDPDCFKPERYLDPQLMNPRDIIFGFGRRKACNSQYLKFADGYL